MTPILLDSAVAIVIILSIVIAFFRGFVREMLTIVNLAGAGAAAWLFGPMMVPTFKGWLGVEPGKKAEDIWGVVPPEIMANFLSYASAFFGVFIILSLAGMAISGGVKSLGLGPVDRVLGMVFGALRGFLFVFLIYLPFGFFMQPDQLPKWAKDSLSVSALHATYTWADKYMKDELPKDGKDAKPVDPDSLRGKLRKMADDAMPDEKDVKEMKEKAEDVTKDILNDDEKTAP